MQCEVFLVARDWSSAQTAGSVIWRSRGLRHTMPSGTDLPHFVRVSVVV
jgi:hypothetical protein